LKHQQKVWLQCKRKAPYKPAVAGRRTTSFCYGSNLYKWFAGSQDYKRNCNWCTIHHVDGIAGMIEEVALSSSVLSGLQSD